MRLQDYLRLTTAVIIAPYLAFKDKRLSSIHRVTDSLTYKLVDTVLCNCLADTIATAYLINTKEINILDQILDDFNQGDK